MFVTSKKLSSRLSALCLIPLCIIVSGTHAQTLPQISGLQMHMDASNSSSLILDDNNNVYAWNDSSGGNIQFTQHTNSVGQATYVDNIVNGQGALHFNGTAFLGTSSENALNMTSDVSGITVIAVGWNAATTTQGYLRINAPGGARFAMETTGGTNNRTRFFARRTDQNQGGALRSVYGDSDSLVTETWRIDTGMVDYANNTGSFYTNGNREGHTTDLYPEGPGNTSNTSSTSVFIGMSNTTASPSAWNGYIAEILVFDRALTEEELFQVHSYLGEKYGIGIIPEPSTYALILGSGMLALALLRKRKK